MLTKTDQNSRPIAEFRMPTRQEEIDKLDALSLAPLVELAWADGRITEGERQGVLEAAKSMASTGIATSVARPCSAGSTRRRRPRCSSIGGGCSPRP